MAGLQSIRAIATIGVHFVLKLILLFAMVALLLIQHVVLEINQNNFNLTFIIYFEPYYTLIQLLILKGKQDYIAHFYIQKKQKIPNNIPK